MKQFLAWRTVSVSVPSVACRIKLRSRSCSGETIEVSIYARLYMISQVRTTNLQFTHAKCWWLAKAAGADNCNQHFGTAYFLQQRVEDRIIGNNVADIVGSGLLFNTYPVKPVPCLSLSSQP